MKPSLAILPLALLVSSHAHAETRTVGAFHAVSISCVLDVELAIGPATHVEVTGPAEWLPRLQSKVEGGVLKLDMPGTWHDVPALHVVITTPSLDAIAITGVVDLRATRLAGKTLSFTDSGVGTVDLAGQVDQLSVAMEGAAELHAKELTAAAVTVQLGGAGNASVHASRAVTAAVSGVGNIIVYGHPAEVTRTVSGVGRIRLR